MAVALNVGQQSLLGYLPAIVIQKILDGEIQSTKNLPAYHKIQTVSLFADISGFTKLSESFSKKGRIGPEFLAFSLNRYMEQLINIIGKNGGDIFKFAGDAILVVWPPTDNLVESCQRAIQCALDIQGKLNNQEISPNKRLSVKIGIGVGECTILVVGGVFGRCEYLSVGDALAQACESETKASAGGETICSEDVYKYIVGKFEVVEAVAADDHGHGPTEGDMKFYKIMKITSERVQIKADAYLMRTKFSSDKLREKINVLKAFVPNAIVKYLDIEKEVWSKEIRMISSMFLNLKVDLKQTKTNEGIERIQKIVKTVQRCVYRTKGSLNKFLMDDKGSVMVICWGLPPMSHYDDHIRSVLCGTTMIEELRKLNCGAYMGVSSGTCFTGVCGTIGGRREYSLLGEIVNLSARHMQQAIYSARDIEKETNVKVEFLQLIDEKTKSLIQNKIFSRYISKGFLKGFQFEFNFYEPILDDRTTYDFNSNLFPEIKTHLNNVPMYSLSPTYKKDIKILTQKSLYMAGRKKELEICKSLLNRVLKNGDAEMILIRGVMGSGKSLFVRRLLNDFLNANRELKAKALQNSLNNPFIFVSYQMPTTYMYPFNGWKTIFKQIYKIYYEQYIIGHKIENTTYEIETDEEETFKIEVDLIGKILFKVNAFRCIRYIEEILEVDLFKHIFIPEDIKEKFFKCNPIDKLEEIDPFFFFRKFNLNEFKIQDFFAKLIKKYKIFIDTFHRENLENPYPLIFVLEDSQHIDEISTDFITCLQRKIDNNICVICTYQDQISQMTSRDPDKFIKSLSIFEDKVYYMENLNDISENQEMIKNNLEGKLSIEKIDTELIEIILPKSFRGVPLFTLEMVDSLVDSNKYVQHPGQELLTTSELLDMHTDRDWSNFVIPMKIEKLVGAIIDDLEFKDIILLKIAATIGNIFDLDKLYKLSPFNFFTLDDMYSILVRMEGNGILEFLYDNSPKRLVCKFAIPFYRDLLYQRMLIEQRNDIHMNIARLMQYNKFSYMPPSVEVDLLKYHLKKTEKSIINYMEEEDNEQMSNNREIKFSTLNNQKIVLVKEICNKLKAIDLKLDEEDRDNKAGLIYQGIVAKKSDSNITWEKRHIVMTNKRFFYYYTDKDYRENKEPLGYFEIKNLYKLEILPDFSIGNKKNIFSITVSHWNKKDAVQKGRNFFLSTETKDKLNEWITQINFLRVKATYDEFASTFGMINLPLSHETPDKGVKKIKNKLNNNSINTVYSNKTSGGFYNSLARRSITINLKVPSESENKKNQLSNKLNKRGSFIPKNINEKILEEIDNQNKIKKSKENLVISFSLAFICILAFTQDIIFNVENIGLREDKTISVSKTLKEFLIKNYLMNENITPMETNNQLITTSAVNGNSSNEEVEKGILKKNSSNLRAVKIKSPIEKIKDEDQNNQHSFRDENIIKSKVSIKKIDFQISKENLDKKEKETMDKQIQEIINEKEKEKQKQKEKEIERQSELQREKEKQIEIEKENLEKERQNQIKREKERQIEIEKENQEKERQNQIQREKERKIEIEKENQEKENPVEIKKDKIEKENEEKQKLILENEILKQKLRENEVEKQKLLENEGAKDIFVNLDYKIRKDKNKETNNTDPNKNSIKYSISIPQNINVLKLREDKRESKIGDLNVIENPNIPSNIFSSNKDLLNIKAKSGIPREIQNNINQNLDKNFELIDIMSNIKVGNTLSNNFSDPRITANNNSNQQNNYNKVNTLIKESRSENTLNNNFTNIPSKQNNNLLTKEKSLSPFKIFIPDPKILNSPETKKIKDDIPSTLISAKLKNFDLANENLEDLFNGKSQAENPENDYFKNKSLKKKKNSKVDDPKYHDVKTTENFNFYSSNVFSNINKK